MLGETPPPSDPEPPSNPGLVRASLPLLEPSSDQLEEQQAELLAHRGRALRSIRHKLDQGQLLEQIEWWFLAFMGYQAYRMDTHRRAFVSSDPVRAVLLSYRSLLAVCVDRQKWLSFNSNACAIRSVAHALGKLQHPRRSTLDQLLSEALQQTSQRHCCPLLARAATDLLGIALTEGISWPLQRLNSALSPHAESLFCLAARAYYLRNRRRSYLAGHSAADDLSVRYCFGGFSLILSCRDSLLVGHLLYRQAAAHYELDFPRLMDLSTTVRCGHRTRGIVCKRIGDMRRLHLLKDVWCVPERIYRHLADVFGCSTPTVIFFPIFSDPSVSPVLSDCPEPNRGAPLHPRCCQPPHWQYFDHDRCATAGVTSN